MYGATVLSNVLTFLFFFFAGIHNFNGLEMIVIGINLTPKLNKQEKKKLTLQVNTLWANETAL